MPSLPEPERLRSGPWSVSYCPVRPELASVPGQITVAEATDLGTDPFVTVITGWPLEHTRSPQMHNAALRAAGIAGSSLPTTRNTNFYTICRCPTATQRSLTCRSFRFANPHSRRKKWMVDEVSAAYNRALTGDIFGAMYTNGASVPAGHLA